MGPICCSVPEMWQQWDGQLKRHNATWKGKDLKWNHSSRDVVRSTCPLERLSHRSGPWGSKEWRSSIRSLSGGSSMVAPTDRVSITAWRDKHTPTYRLSRRNTIWTDFLRSYVVCSLLIKKEKKEKCDGGGEASQKFSTVITKILFLNRGEHLHQYQAAACKCVAQRSHGSILDWGKSLWYWFNGTKPKTGSSHPQHWTITGILDQQKEAMFYF